jgi:putative transposase
MSLAKRFTRMVKAAIITADPSSALAIAEGQNFAHDTVYRVLTEEKLCFTMLAIQKLKALGGLKGGYLILDDSFMFRYASGQLKLKKLKDSAHNRYAHGFNVVLLIWTNGTIRIPVGFRLFLAQPGEASKICLALELLEEARMIGLQPKYVLFDSWYSSESILNWVDQAGWLFVTQLRKNRLLDAVPVKVDRRPYWVKVGKLQKVRCETRVVRHGKRYLVSNDLGLDRAGILRVYRVRQNVEEAFRLCKQELGWEGMRFRTRQTLEAHLALTLAGYAVIEAQRSVLKLSFYKLRRGLVSGRVEAPVIVLDDGVLAA